LEITGIYCDYAMLAAERQVIPVLTVISSAHREKALVGDLRDAIEHDPEVWRARRVADAARTRLVACVTGSREGIDPAEAQRMLDAFRNAMAHAEEAEDQVLVHRGLLTSVEADRRAARRRPVTSRADRPASAAQEVEGVVRVPRVLRVLHSLGVLRVRRASAARGIAGTLALAAAGVVGVAFARWFGNRWLAVRPPLVRW
jgi:hypothetical protein